MEAAPAPRDSPADPAASAPPSRPLARALLTTAAATAAPGTGHLLLGRSRTGALVLGAFLLTITAVAVLTLTADPADLIAKLVSTEVLIAAAVGCVAGAAAWIAVIIRTYQLARPPDLDRRWQAAGVAVVTALCLLVAGPFGYAAHLANSQRTLLDTLFPGEGGGTAVAEAITKPRLNVLLVGSDAGPDRRGARTDTMMVASVDTRSGRTTLFGLPRNIGYAQFPPGSPMAEEFPDGFHDRRDPKSGEFLLNAVYGYGHQFPALAPPGPSADPGLNLLHQTVSHMLGLPLDYYVTVDMAGFASIVDALGGLTVDVGPERIPIGGISPSGRLVRPDGYIDPGVQRLDGAKALAFARSRTGTTDYARMGRQRCLLQNILEQKSPTDLLANFQAVASATTASVSTNIPQPVLPELVSLAGDPGSVALESISFDPQLPDPSESDGWFDTGRPNFTYMREVVQDAVTRAAAPPVAAPTAAAPAPVPPPAAAAPAPTRGRSAPTPPPPPATAIPTPLAAACG